MSSKWILSIMIIALVGCMMPEEGTIIYEQDYPDMPTDNAGKRDVSPDTKECEDESGSQFTTTNSRMQEGIKAEYKSVVLCLNSPASRLHF